MEAGTVGYGSEVWGSELRRQQPNIWLSQVQAALTGYFETPIGDIHMFLRVEAGAGINQNKNRQKQIGADLIQKES